MKLISHTHRVVVVANKDIFTKHFTGKHHPESPQRVEAIEKGLIEANLMHHNNAILPRQATMAEVMLCHDQEYLIELRRQTVNLQDQHLELAPFDTTVCQMKNVSGDFQMCPQTLTVALYAAGAPLTAIEHILNEKNQTSRAFCIVRPPGHHAHSCTGSGFCVLNNVAIAAKHLTQNLGFQRVLIVDWDAHHGDGTQEITQEDPKIFYFSTHKDTSIGQGFYPGPYWGSVEQQGIGKGKGTVLNCPVSGSQDKCREQILKAFKTQLIHEMDRYQPDFVLISCGFDAHEKDPLVGLGLRDEDYGELTMICAQIAEKYAAGRMISVLEGGYNLSALASAAQVHVRMMGLT